MGSLTTIGRKLYVVYKFQGKWVREATGLSSGQEKKAWSYLEKIEARIAAGLDAGTGPLTVRKFAEKWSKEREARGISSARDERGRLRNHALPEIGSLELKDVRPHHIRDLARKLRTKPCGGKEGATLAPRTQGNVIADLHALFQDALVDELVDTNPVVLGKGERPKMADKDPHWRGTAIFTRAEVEQLISDGRLSEERRMVHALMFLTGMRFGEVSALRWSHWDPTLEPLGRLMVEASYSTHQKREKSTKTGCTRKVPVHHVLARMLKEWRVGGWARFVGRHPKPDDLIVPGHTGSHRNANDSIDSFRLACKKLGLRDDRRQHDSRRTFVSLCQDNGATRERLRWVTHGRGSSVMDLYDEPAWRSLCEEVSKLQIEPRGANVVELPVAVAQGEGPGALSNRCQIEDTPQDRPIDAKQRIYWRPRQESNLWQTGIRNPALYPTELRGRLGAEP
jgi:integrase